MFLIVSTVVLGSYEWDTEKAADNIAKHGVSFVEAISALQDPRAAYVAAGDEQGEPRFAAIGMSAMARLLLVVHVERGDRDRIISARHATAAEENLYAQVVTTCLVLRKPLSKPSRRSTSPARRSCDGGRARIAR